MTLRAVHVAAIVLFAALSVPCSVAQAARRIVVLDVFSGSAGAADLHDRISNAIVKHGGFELADEKRMRRAVSALQNSAKFCDDNCAHVVAGSLHADQVVSATLTESRGSFVLRLTLRTLKDDKPPRGASVTASSADELAGKVGPCLTQLFGWDDIGLTTSPAVVPSPLPEKAPPVPPAIIAAPSPPPDKAAPAPPAPPVHPPPVMIAAPSPPPEKAATVPPAPPPPPPPPAPVAVVEPPSPASPPEIRAQADPLPASTAERPVLALFFAGTGPRAVDARSVATELDEFDAMLTVLRATGKLTVIVRTLPGHAPDTATRDANDCEGDPGCLATVGRTLGASHFGALGFSRADGHLAYVLKIIDCRSGGVLLDLQQAVQSEDEPDPAADALATQVVNRLASPPAASAPPPAIADTAAPPGPGALPPAAPAERMAPESPAPPVSRLTATMSRGREAGIASMAFGALALVVATVVGVTVQNDSKTLVTKPDAPILSQVGSINTRAYTTDALIAVGGAAAGVGVGLTVVFP